MAVRHRKPLDRPPPGKGPQQAPTPPPPLEAARLAAARVATTASVDHMGGRWCHLRATPAACPRQSGLGRCAGPAGRAALARSPAEPRAAVTARRSPRATGAAAYQPPLRLQIEGVASCPASRLDHMAQSRQGARPRGRGSAVLGFYGPGRGPANAADLAGA